MRTRLLQGIARRKIGIKVISVMFFATLLAVMLVVMANLSSIGAYLILHPPHRHTKMAPPAGCVEVNMEGAGVPLMGWRGDCKGRSRGTVIYLHGVADNRASGAGVLERFLNRGFDVLAFDSRAHGDSGGKACTYGFFEKEDLKKVMNTLRPGPVILIGTSLGGAVALQLAAVDKRVSAVVSAEAFSDFRIVATERAPFFFTSGTIKRSFVKAEAEAGFRIDEVSPATAAKGIVIPVLIIHGAADVDTPPVHAKRIFAALSGEKRLMIAAGVPHNESLSGGEIWREIESWVDSVIPPIADKE